MVYIIKEGYNPVGCAFSAAQVKRPKQITKKEELVVGRKLRVGNRGKVSRTILEILALDSPEPNFLKVRRTGEISKGYSMDYQGNISLADYGVVPYAHGKWNCANYLMPAEDVEEVKA